MSTNQYGGYATLSHLTPLEKLHLIDGEMTSWYGSRAIRGLDYLARLAEAERQHLESAIRLT